MRDPIAVMASRMIYDGDCWTWVAARSSKGYGALRHEGKVVQAHRLSYQLHVGPIPDGLVIDHLCRNRACINPDHLEPVTNAVNIQRGEANSARTKREGVCQRGHEMTRENAYVKPSTGGLICRACDAARGRARRSRVAA